jgi:hypothetical protein
MPLAPVDDYVIVPGKVDILIATPANYLNLFKIGESEDGIEVRKIPMVGGVKGDRYGGNSGNDIEKQFFGLRAEFGLTMTRWSPVNVAMLENFGGLLAANNPGLVPIQSIGALLMRDRGYRFLLYCYREPTLSLNFPCCTWTTPQGQGRGTKAARCSMQITAERAPEGFWHTASVGFVYNSDTTGIPIPYVFN